MLEQEILKPLVLFGQLRLVLGYSAVDFLQPDDLILQCLDVLLFSFSVSPGRNKLRSAPSFVSSRAVHTVALAD